MWRTLAVIVAVVLAVGCQREQQGSKGAPPAAAAAATSSPENFASFWPRFREAILADDFERLADMTRFPLDVRGDFDADPVVRRDRSEFKQLLSS